MDFGGGGVGVRDGGGGHDTLTGAGGADRFVLAETPRGFNYDQVMDFAVGIDRILLDSGALINLDRALA